MNILVTGSNGFIGKHITKKLEDNGYSVFKYDIDSTENDLIKYIKNADFVIHLAGINRPLNKEKFYNGNTDFTKKLVDLILENKRFELPIIMSSSIQASLNNDYGKSKLLAENYLLSSNLPVYIFRLSNVFGNGCKPNYNSAFATFCYNIAHNLEININESNPVINLNYIDDITNKFISILELKEYKGSKDILYIKPTYQIRVKDLANLIYYFKNSIESENHLPKLNNLFEYYAFKTFLSYLRNDNYNYNFAKDDRGSFEELYKSNKYGQISENISYPNITKGGHYHTYKKEIFCVVEGKCLIKQECINSDDKIINICSGDDIKCIDIIPNYSHSITNIGSENSITLMWISEIYDESKSDTYKFNK